LVALLCTSCCEGEHFWDGGSLAGEGAKVLYVWLGLFTLQLWRWDEIVI
jgi:hypothetical protein